MRKFYVLDFVEDGVTKYGEFYSYLDALNYAESLSGIYGMFTISEYDSEEDYYNNL